MSGASLALPMTWGEVAMQYGDDSNPVSGRRSVTGANDPTTVVCVVVWLLLGLSFCCAPTVVSRLGAME